MFWGAAKRLAEGKTYPPCVLDYMECEIVAGYQDLIEWGAVFEISGESIVATIPGIAFRGVSTTTLWSDRLSNEIYELILPHLL